MKIGIYTIEKTLYEGDTKEVIAKTTTGEISILENHIPLVTRLEKGTLRVIKKDGHEEKLELASGILEIQPQNSIVVLLDTV
jgi:F-type H+-transporting ATPase subunit epsilon